MDISHKLEVEGQAAIFTDPPVDEEVDFPFAHKPRDFIGDQVGACIEYHVAFWGERYLTPTEARRVAGLLYVAAELAERDTVDKLMSTRAWSEGTDDEA